MIQFKVVMRTWTWKLFSIFFHLFIKKRELTTGRIERVRYIWYVIIRREISRDNNQNQVLLIAQYFDKDVNTFISTSNNTG